MEEETATHDIPNDRDEDRVGEIEEGETTDVKKQKSKKKHHRGGRKKHNRGSEFTMSSNPMSKETATHDLPNNRDQDGSRVDGIKEEETTDFQKRKPKTKYHEDERKEHSRSPESTLYSNHMKEEAIAHGNRDDQNIADGTSEKETKRVKKRKPKTKYYEGETRKHTKRKHIWDFMLNMRDDDGNENYSDRNWSTLDVAVKIIVSILISIIVLGAAVISKLSLVLITSNIMPPMNDTDLYWQKKTANLSLNFKYRETNVQWIWALVLVIAAPYIFTIISCIWNLLLSKKEWGSSWKGFPQIMLQETIHSAGLCMMAFVLLPSFDPIAGILVCFHVATIPGFLGIFERFSDPSHSVALRVLQVVALVLQLAAIGFACGYYANGNETKERILQIITICVSPVFVSIYWWENYFLLENDRLEPEAEQAAQNNNHQNKEKVTFTGCLKALLSILNVRPAKVDILVHLWKVIITVLFPIFLFGLPCQDFRQCTDTLFLSNRNSTFATGVGSNVLSSTISFKNCTSYYLPLIVALVAILCNGACYRAVKFGCQMVAQIPCVSIPLTVSSPLALAVLFWILNEKFDSCLSSYPSLDANRLNTLLSSHYWMVIVSGICGYLSFVIICLHIWKPDYRRLKKSKELFSRSLYCGVLFDQSIRLNIIRKRTDKKENGKGMIGNKKRTDNPKIYLCATMWHETKSEMTKLILSILRLDEDHKKIKQMKEKIGFFTEDFFDFEVHIFFDDAFETRKDEKGKEVIELNAYVRNLIEVVRDVTEEKKLPVSKCSTKYGGQLKWELPNDNVMFAHLKHKNLIRRKKRWSQVMYMYYFLGYQFVDEMKTGGFEIENMEDVLSTIAKDSALRGRIENKFILALDGDVDFQPEAVKYLLDRMSKEKRIGAACGRIHPTGNGPIVWYQRFEYAVSHWLQKVAENVLGCVLCSPGCFSLFRGSALIDVMKVYTTYPTESFHHIQYDQGEDRWLCTLLLQQGYKVEYVAASDAFTEAPVGFSEFFNQRRRWTPSTMANIIDLILDWKHVAKINSDISRLYILYQAFLMFASILTPGMILLMIVGALIMTFPALPLWVALLMTILPVAAFIGVCFNARAKTQLKFAVILSISYAIVMMIVLVGLVVHMVQNGLCSITTIFFIYVAGVFLISALLHPKEFSCVLHGFLYFIAIPCSSLIMMLYALCNLNITSWGTRETIPKQDTNHGIAHKGRHKSESSHGIGSFFRCLWCSHESSMPYLSDRLDAIEKTLSNITNKNDTEIESKKMTETATQTVEQKTHTNGGKETSANDLDTSIENRTSQMMHSVSNGNESPGANCDLSENEEQFTNKEWEKDKLLKGTKHKGLNKTEKKFWMNMIRRYLFPKDLTDQEKTKIENDLIILRNKVCLFFILVNALFITIVFVLQQIAFESDSKSKRLSVPIPCFAGENRTNFVEPISFAFTFVFGIILLIQFICMIFHRLDTLKHVCSRTEIFKIKSNKYRNMWKLLADINRAVRKNQIKKQSIFQPNSVYPVAESETNRQHRARKNWDTVKEAVLTENSKKANAMKMFREQIKRVEDLKEKFGKNDKKENLMMSIKETFPDFTKEAHQALYMLCTMNDDSKSLKEEGDRVDSPNASGELPRESPEL